MRIRIFRAPTLSSAMAQIRRELGPEALILAERCRDGSVEVTAALETTQTVELRAPGTPIVAAAVRKLQWVDDLEPFHTRAAASHRPQPALSQSGTSAAPLADALSWHGLSLPLIDALSLGSLETACARVFQFQPICLENHATPLLLAGPPGGGKTLTVARLATRLVLAGQNPLVVTADAQRAGAIEQLAAFTRLLGLTMVAASTPEMLAKAMTRRSAGQPVLIDAPGLDLDNPSHAALLGSLVSASGAATVLVLPCGLDPSEARDISSAHAALGAKSVVATRTDVSRRLGGILCAASSADLALSEAGVSSAAADGLVALTPAFLAERLRGRGVNETQPAPKAGALSVHIAAQQRASGRS